MRVRRPWAILIGVLVVGGAAWLISATMFSPGHNGPSWRAAELTLGVGCLIAVAFVWSRVARADARHLRRLIWQRDGRCGGCGYALDAGVTVCPGCGAGVQPHAPGGPGREPCTACGYPLAGIRGDRCPECGTLVRPPRA